MSEIKYLISDTSKQLGVEPHVLRYWEEELDMPIKRNEMGHRYYTEDDIRVLKSVRDMKERGIQLKAIKHILKELYVNSEYDPQTLEQEAVQNITAKQQTDAVQDEAVLNGAAAVQTGSAMNGAAAVQTGSAVSGGAALQAMPHGEAVSVMSSDLKMEQFQEIMFRIIARALEKNNISLSGTISSEISDKVSEQVAEAVSERVSVNVTEHLTENVSERVSASVTERISEDVSERVSQRVSEDVSIKVSDSVSDRVSGQVSEQVIKQMDYILRENEEREEERFRKLDEAIRQRQKANAEAAAALMEDSKKKKKHTFGKKEKRRSRLFG